MENWLKCKVSLTYKVLLSIIASFHLAKRMTCSSVFLRKTWTSYITDSIFSSLFNPMFTSNRSEAINNSDNLFYPARILFNYFTASVIFLRNETYISARIFVDGKKKMTRECFMFAFYYQHHEMYAREKYSASLSWSVSICFRFVGQEAIEKYRKC